MVVGDPSVRQPAADASAEWGGVALDAVALDDHGVALDQQDAAALVGGRVVLDVVVLYRDRGGVCRDPCALHSGVAGDLGAHDGGRAAVGQQDAAATHAGAVDELHVHDGPVHPPVGVDARAGAAAVNDGGVPRDALKGETGMLGPDLDVLLVGAGGDDEAPFMLLVSSGRDGVEHGLDMALRRGRRGAGVGVVADGYAVFRRLVVDVEVLQRLVDGRRRMALVHFDGARAVVAVGASVHLPAVEVPVGPLLRGQHMSVIRPVDGMREREELVVIRGAVVRALDLDVGERVRLHGQDQQRRDLYVEGRRSRNRGHVGIDHGHRKVHAGRFRQGRGT